MKFKFKKNKKTGEVLISYATLKDNSDLRYYVLSKIFEKYPDDITIIIDTNRRENKLSHEEIENLLKDSNISYKDYKVERTGGKLLGMNFSGLNKKKKNSERMYILSITADEFKRQLFDELLTSFDLAVGINKVCEFDKLCDEVRIEGLENVLFNDEFFSECIYDSMLVLQMKTYIDVTEFNV